MSFIVTKRGRYNARANCRGGSGAGAGVARGSSEEGGGEKRQIFAANARAQGHQCRSARAALEQSACFGALGRAWTGPWRSQTREMERENGARRCFPDEVVKMLVQLARARRPARLTLLAIG